MPSHVGKCPGEGGQYPASHPLTQGSFYWALSCSETRAQYSCHRGVPRGREGASGLRRTRGAALSQVPLRARSLSN